MKFTAEHNQISDTVRKFVANEINPFTKEWEKAGQFPAHELFKKLGDLGLLGIKYPTEFGGMGLDFSYSMVMAEALGGKVEKAEQGWGIGVHSLNVVKHESWMQPQQTSCGIQYSHRDQVTLLPERGVLLGESGHCPVAMFRVGEKMLGIQGHPEFRAAYVEALVRGRTAMIGEEKVNAARFDALTDEAIITYWLAKFLQA